MGAAIGLVLLAITIVILWAVYVGLYGHAPLAIADGPYGIDAWVPVVFLLVAIVIIAALPVILERVRPQARTFRDQMAANEVNGNLLVIAIVLGVALTFDILFTVVTLRTSGGLLAAEVGVILAVVAVVLAVRRGDRLVIRLSGAKPANRATDARLLDVVAEMAVAANIPMPSVYVIESAAPNAFVIGPEPSRSSLIATRGLISSLTREEMQGVIAHEVSHIRNLDGRYGLLVTVLLGTALLLVDGAFSIVTFPFRAVGRLIGAGSPSGDGTVHFSGSGGHWSFPNLGGSGGGGGGHGGGGGKDAGAAILAILIFVLIVILIVWLLKVLVPVLSRLARAAVGREREFLADASAVEIGRNPGALESALIKVATNRGTVPSINRATAALCFVSPIRSFEDRGRSLFATHPQTIDRVNRLRTLQGEPPLQSIPGNVTAEDDMPMEEAHAG
jgi:heat shock protein HtpX